jgi:hypothetical protein
MPPAAGPDPRSLAARRRARIDALRMRVAALTVAGFLVIWAGLFVQLASGHDPGLNDGAGAAVVQSADPVVTDDRENGRPDAAASGLSDDATAPTGDAAANASAGAPAAATDGGAVVTRQS